MYSQIKRNEIQVLATTWMNYEDRVKREKQSLPILPKF